MTDVLMARAEPVATTTGDSLWYRDAIIYEARVRAFHDANGDGIGDFIGLEAKLDYLHDLGVTAIWLLPFYPSPLRDDGYDISDYTAIHPDVGTLEDFQKFLRRAHKLGIRVITELVINHTSDQHPWFQRARRAPPGSRYRNYYVWSDTPDRYQETRIIFQDFEHSNWSWDPVARAYFWHRFYSHQPDLNFDSPDVRKAVFRALDFWLGMGVDGLRLDAIPYLFERDGTNCENLPETHAFLREIRAHVDARHPHRMLLAEANQWPEDAVAYFGGGDECHMAFHFPLMPRLFMAIQMENRFPILDILQQTPELPPTCQWALFLRNHDELTLEMVTDEERDYMYRVYAQDAQARINLGIRRRLAPLLGNDRRRIELMNALLFSLPGTPVIYYGDEIGMGDNFFLGDRHGVRTPMQWSSDKNAGFSRANPQRLYLPVIYDPEYHYETINVEAQNNNPNSLLRWMKRLIALRKSHQAFGRGSMTLLTPSNRKVLAFIRSHEGEDLLVVANLGNDVEYAELDLSTYRGAIPIELSGMNPFPRLGDGPFLLTLGPYAYYWFKLDRGSPSSQRQARAEHERISGLVVRGKWDAVLRGADRTAFEKTLPDYLRGRRWFGGKARAVDRVAISDVLRVPLDESEDGALLLLEVTYQEGPPESYAVPVVFLTGEVAHRLRHEQPESVLIELMVRQGEDRAEGVVCDGLVDPRFAEAAVHAMLRRRQIRGTMGVLAGSRTGAVAADAALAASANGSLRPVRWLDQDQSNSSVNFADRFILKLFRRITEGINPELEMGRFLSQRKFPHVAPVIGALEYTAARRAPLTVGVLQAWVPNEGDVWRFTIDQLQGYFEQALGRVSQGQRPPDPDGHVLDTIDQPAPPQVAELFGAYMETARLLGQRTAEMHLVLASDRETPAFAPEPYTTLYQRSLYQSMRNLTAQTLQQLREQLPQLDRHVALDARRLVDLEPRILEVFRTITGRRIDTLRIRIHGDYHLGQVLHTGRDFVIIDFEGEPGRPVQERRIKRSPLRDVVSMLRSFDYAVHTLLLGTLGARVIRPDDVPALEPWARFWVRWVSASFVRSYLGTAGQAGFIPQSPEDLRRLFTVLLLEKNIYEVGYELNHRPQWLPIPALGILRLLREPA
ncbi:MAG TPA: maltose alpha-D-glucosyltransferase [Gemmatimonadaceae bacterium]|nr:maltose alpha-D-glucosyltransferase [Gemmatimonadaceae bacterium]